MPCFYGNGDGIVGVMRCKDSDGCDVDDGGDSNLGLAQVVRIRPRQDGDGHCDGTEVVEETKNKPDPEKKTCHKYWDATATAVTKT